MRSNRKLEHIEISLQQRSQRGATGFNDITLVHNSLPELNWEEVDLSCTFLGQPLKAPLLINAMTGGHPQLEDINYYLARAAAVSDVAIAVGSQRAALEEASARRSFTVVREAHPQGVVLANLGADCTLAEAKEAISMIGANALQLHLNAPQELAMAEGDRNFRGILENIEALAKQLKVPVVVKEVGFGMSRESVKRLAEVGVSYIDIGGAGGTDFMAIEQSRSGKKLAWNWGIPTAISLLEGLTVSDDINIIASGGIEHALDCVKALSLGCCLIGMARPLLKVLINGSPEQLTSCLEALINDMRRIMLMLGAKDLLQLKEVPLVISGQTFHWVTQRGISVEHYAQRFRKTRFTPSL
ncbi:type 2 isopentenyl-diphosphate Delta-isomerase [Desulforamulus aeronauticus]|uniref:Isopentenyl-diphosphate delta-isomerase n=1 Tax=Desulforamulus aeronauticus DSM 10349 TaxID=1121421 RepID=A0A1M6QRU6_9FIRM|nr:type 2 isopentenyl-diphosphate Delta-isomerase [Desulforamulus aeronauticus]SHK22830.1 isopentenyl-diphosphate delta-isomerase [Desulforamulus aeronauticus DSM 10349]